MSPYIVRVSDQSPVAVATLEEAQAAALEAIEQTAPFQRVPHSARRAYSRSWATFAESGGTVGPLPDGTVIEVASRTWEELANDERAEGWPDEMAADAGWAEAHRRILDAFNARQS